MKIAVAISGASGASLGLKTIELLPESVQKHLIISKNAKIVLKHENNITVHNDRDIASSPASGSFKMDALMIVPCSMNTLAKISCGIADNLTTRAAAVMLKENKKLLLAPREMPFSAISLENMHKLSTLGVIIAPPILAYYSKQTTLQQMEEFMIGKWFDLLGIKNDLYKRWGEDE